MKELLGLGANIDLQDDVRDTSSLGSHAYIHIALCVYALLLLRRKENRL